MAWAWQYGPWDEGPVGELADARGKTLTVSADDVSTVSFDLPGDSRHYQKIIPLVTDIWVTQDGDDECPFRGRATSRSGNLTIRRSSRSQGAVGYKALVSATDVNAASFNTWTDYAPTDAAWDTFTAAGSLANSNLRGIIRGPRHASTPRTFSMGLYQQLDTALNDIAKQASATWDVTPRTVEQQQFDFWPGGVRGTDRGVIIDLGGRAVSATDQVAVDGYGNVFTNVGQPEGGTANDTGVPDFGWIETARVPDLATRPEGRWTRVLSSNQTKQPAVNAEAVSALRNGQIVPIAWTAVLRRGFWQGRQHLWPGDPFTWVCKAPGYDVVETHVVNSLTADFSTNPQRPKVTIQFGAPAPSDRRRRLRVDQSLAQLAFR